MLPPNMVQLSQVQLKTDESLPRKGYKVPFLSLRYSHFLLVHSYSLIEILQLKYGDIQLDIINVSYFT